MKLREVTEEDVMRFGRIEEEDRRLIPAILSAARSYVLGYTGLSLEETDPYEDITLACLVLCCEMYDNRNLTVELGNAKTRYPFSAWNKKGMTGSGRKRPVPG